MIRAGGTPGPNRGKGVGLPVRTLCEGLLWGWGPRAKIARGKSLTTPFHFTADVCRCGTHLGMRLLTSPFEDCTGLSQGTYSAIEGHRPLRPQRHLWSLDGKGHWENDSRGWQAPCNCMPSHQPTRSNSGSEFSLKGGGWGGGGYWNPKVQKFVYQKHPKSIFPFVSHNEIRVRRGGWNKALVVGSVCLWRRLLASRL